jgi:hypothetical protein
MSERELNQLDELKADGEDSSTNDPVTGAGGAVKKRKADANSSAEKADTMDMNTPQGTAGKKAPARLADKSGMRESVEEMFGDTDLSEDFKEKATVVFEAAVNAKLYEEVALIEEQFETKLDEQVELAISDIVEKVDDYLDYVVEQWMEDNKIAIERGIRGEIAESFLEGLKDLFIEHNVNLPEEEVDVIADIVDQLEETEAKLNDAINESIELKKALTESKKVEILESYTKDLTDTQAEKFFALAEGVDYNDLADFKRKVKIINEQYFGSKSILTEAMGDIDPIEDAKPVRHIDSTMAAYTQAITKTLRK